ncbi:putative methyltransferase [Brevundimonas alba]|uniref:Putative methyltransferase n=1 Tax=Brevundimonas alba TaxID=74314 RepID=A0A7X5YLR0_9CAUL|nr:class I SAM-dependent methyltransferase [Brevundimonas alba]NJC40974.1 putative methyltransferase [Brevundimonas alba]
MAESHEGWRPLASRRKVLSGAVGLLALAGCGREKTAEPPPQPDGPPKGSLEWAVAGPWRAQDRARDQWRHPMETLRFFGLQPRMAVVEFWPGSGWWTEILAPYLAEGEGRYIAAGFQTGPGASPAQTALTAAFQERFTNDRRLYGEIELTTFGPTSGPIAPPGTVDLALFMRNIHNWMAAGIAEKAFSDAYAALRPGGILGIEQHRLGPDKDQDPTAADGYVQEAFVKQLAAEAGFAFVAASEINANERDTKDHPFGVETLPPMGLTAPRGSPPDPTFDRSKYDEIGESDRMTLKFRKPE